MEEHLLSCLRNLDKSFLAMTTLYNQKMWKSPMRSWALAPRTGHSTLCSWSFAAFHDDTLYSLDVEVTSEIRNIPYKGLDIVHCVPGPLQLSDLELLEQLWLKSLQLACYPENWPLPSCWHLEDLSIHIFFLNFCRYNKEDLWHLFYLLLESMWPH